MEILPFLIWPFVASLILTGIHAYLGVHVVERGVIFVDLALAQIAALGATIAILVGMDPHGRGAYFLSLGFTFLGAAIFAMARSRRGHIPQEAFIGIAYAVASAAAILAMSKATGETEHLKDMLVGNILSVVAGARSSRPPFCTARSACSITSFGTSFCSYRPIRRRPNARDLMSACGISFSMPRSALL